MSLETRRRNDQATSAEISLVHLKNCLVNLPSSLTSLLVNTNTLAQNTIIELTFRAPPPQGSDSKTATQKSIFVGWTGMPSKRRLAPIVGRDGISGTRGNPAGREQEVSLVEMDTAFARTLGIHDGLKITASLHFDPPVAHTINIEPLTPEDWEIIELHATFLELNLVSQIRALPSPHYITPNGSAVSPHPLTLHLSPTSTANIIITSLAPAPPSNYPFAKLLAPDAEVIVAPKTRTNRSRPNGENRSVSSRKSAGGGSGASTIRRRSAREGSKPALFLRGLDRSLCGDYFESGRDAQDQGMKVWVDRDVLATMMKDVTWICATLIRPPALQAPVDPQKQQQEAENAGNAGKVTSRVVARLMPWDDPPDSQHIALSSALCASIACEGLVGGIVKIEPAPLQISKSAQARDSVQPAPKMTQSIKIYPFFSEAGKKSDGLKFGGESKAEREETSKRIVKLYNSQPDSEGLFSGPLTDGSILAPPQHLDNIAGWEGGIMRLEYSPTEQSKSTCNWFLASERRFTVDVQAPIPKPSALSGDNTIGNSLSATAPALVGIDNLIEQLQGHLSHMSSVLLTGALGSGKTAVTYLLAHRLKSKLLFHTTYFSCRKLVTDETRVSTIKETFTRLLMNASWGARLGGKSLVILDDLDKLCPVETEVEQSENGRSRQISEGLCAVVRQYCDRDSGVVILATAQAKESLHNVIVGGHVVREIVNLKAPNKEARRRITQLVVKQNASETTAVGSQTSGSRPSTADTSASEGDEDGWMAGGRSGPSRSASAAKGDTFSISEDLDFLDLAGETDGYMPGDLVLLVGRARSEALIRSVSTSSKAKENTVIIFGREDFDAALKGFTPASLRNVTLQTSTTTFDSIGGLKETRKILLETLQYPTTYAPIFAQCPLRLRSGLLLYGFPGCGKTMLASAVAGECGLNFISVKGPEILNKYIGASEKSVRDLFDRAEAARPCVLFFDEFDSIAPKRGHDSTGVTDRVVNQLLTQMDGAEGLSGVYVLAATSRPDLIDPALLRPGRLDKSLICDLPNLEDRVDILRALGRKLKLSDDLISSPEGGLEEIARRAEGYSGADLQALVYNAHLEAIHEILGDQDHEQKPVGKSNGVPSASSRNFLQFRYGEDEERLEAAARLKSGNNASKLLAERAGIMQKLDAIKKAKKMGKSRGVVAEKEAKEEQEQQEVVIEWKHIEKGLRSTRASISIDERRRLEGIYREFVVGRNGEMPSGQGGTEVGGRSSLM
ncbi:P-loop containing nucleoside triphosphate hydrolase protein [Calycina marina]|uniref:Peroxisomal ATPase PEX1 n=1 Tax=Calycina marina TaxID=1763456 RepID=A0A9P8CG06_9HELO|nr:P-loop containing nucleoside triphosphate hydrolase protein [Calycina marina]